MLGWLTTAHSPIGKNPEKFGLGEKVLGKYLETANNGTTGGAMVPTTNFRYSW